MAAAQTQVNPATQIQWPAITGSGAPAGGACSSVNYGQPYTNTAANTQYFCSASGWVLIGASSGSVTGQANGVVPLATASTSIGAQSHIDDGVTTSSVVTVAGEAFDVGTTGTPENVHIRGTLNESVLGTASGGTNYAGNQMAFGLSYGSGTADKWTFGAIIGSGATPITDLAAYGPANYTLANANTNVGELLSQAASLAAAGGVNLNTPFLTLQGASLNGSAVSVADSWTMQGIAQSGGNLPAEYLTFTHAGSSGLAAVSVPVLIATSGTKGVNNNGAQWTGGTSLPGTCNVGDYFSLTTAGSYQAALQVCYPANTWNTLSGTGGGITGSGTNKYLPAWTSSSAVGNSHIDDGGTTSSTLTATEALVDTVSVTSPLIVSSAVSCASGTPYLEYTGVCGAGSGNLPTVVGGRTIDAGMGTGGSLAATFYTTGSTIATDGNGWLTLVMGATGTAANTGVVTVNFGGTYSTPPRCGVGPANNNSSTLFATAPWYITPSSSTTSNFVITSGSTAPSVNATYVIHYWCSI